MNDVADIWDHKPVKAWHNCVACEQLKIIVWLGMCGGCAVAHKKATIERREEHKKMLAERLAQQQEAA